MTMPRPETASGAAWGATGSSGLYNRAGSGRIGATGAESIDEDWAERESMEALRRSLPVGPTRHG
jgi:hypothetical protein